MSAGEKPPTPRDVFERTARFAAAAPLTHCLAEASMLETVRVVVQKDDQVLVGRREGGSNPNSIGKKELLGGKIDPEEKQKAEGDIEAAIIAAGLRELDEEGSIKIKPAGLAFLQMYRIPNVPEEGRHRGKLVIEYLLYGDHIAGEPRTSEEHQSVWWTDPALILGDPEYRAGSDRAVQMTIFPAESYL